MTTETDDLSYYETELPKVIAGVRRGEKWEYQGQLSGDWNAPVYQGMAELFDFVHGGYRVRLAPVPVVKTWDCGGDLPAASVWLRWKSTPHLPMMVIGVVEDGLQFMGQTEMHIARWSELPNLEHSTDLRNWSDCVKPEGGK